MIRNSKQVWEVGFTVKIGFLTLRITEKVATPGDWKPDMYRLESLDKTRKYEFVPHNGLERVDNKYQCN